MKTSSDATAREVVDRQPPALPVTQLCVWLGAFCVGLLALLMSMPGESRAEASPELTFTPDPNYLARRCSEPDTGIIMADMPSCMFAPRNADWRTSPARITTTPPPERTRAR